jgi:hypothetical protein
MAINASFCKNGWGIGGIGSSIRGKSIVFGPYFTHPIQMGKTFLQQQTMQSIGRGLQGFGTGANFEPVEYPGALDGYILKQVCRHLSGKAISTNPEIIKLLDNWTFNVLANHPGLCDQLLTVILIDQDMDELHNELWRTKNQSNKALHDRTWNRAKEQLRQAYEDYEIIRRLTDPDCQYLIYNPKH